MAISANGKRNTPAENGEAALPDRGKLYGIGVGPGDPELLTLKAINALRACDIIAVPASATIPTTSKLVASATIPTTSKLVAAGAGDRAALATVERYIGGKELLECRFVMEHDMERRRAARRIAADGIMRCLDMGKDVGFVTLGDPTTYSTYMYVHEIIVAEGYDAQIIPGVTSYAAAAASLGIALCEDGEPLHIIPAGRRKKGATSDSGLTQTCDVADEWDALLDLPGNKVVMKSGDNLARVLKRLKAAGYGDRTKIACRVTMDGQRLYANIDEYERSPETGYFTVVIVK